MCNGKNSHHGRRASPPGNSNQRKHYGNRNHVVQQLKQFVERQK